MTSRPLFISVAESIVILRPICHVGCCSASAAVTLCELGRRAGRGTVRPTPSARAASPRDASRPCRHWWMALCSLSTGRIATPRRRAAVGHDAAGHDQHFLVGQRDRLAALDRGEHGLERRRCPTTRRARCRRRDAWRPRRARRARRRQRRRRVGADAPRTRVERVRRSPWRPRAGRYRAICAASSSAFSPAARPTTSQAVGDARRRPRARSGRSSRSIRGWRCASRGHGSHSGEHTSARCSRPGAANSSASMRSSTPPWPGMSAELSFTPALRFSIDSNRSPAMPSATIVDAEQRRAAATGTAGSHQRADDARTQRAEDEAADRALDGLLRADRRRQRAPAERAPGVVLRRVADDDRQHQQEQRLAARASRESPPARRSAGPGRATETATPTRSAERVAARRCQPASVSVAERDERRPSARRRAARHADAAERRARERRA